MLPQTAILKLRVRLNKLHSSDYDNVTDWAAVEAINKSALEIVRICVSGTNSLREGSEETKIKIDDLQFLLKPTKLSGNDMKEEYFEAKLPTDYLYFNRIIPFGKKGKCVNQPLYSDLKEEANVPVLLQDWANKPNWEWRHTFHTLLSDKLRIYKAGEFNIEKVDMVYYRKPKQMDILGYTHEDGRNSTNENLEFKDDICEIIIDNAASIIAGDIESVNQMQINQQRFRTNI